MRGDSTAYLQLKPRITLTPNPPDERMDGQIRAYRANDATATDLLVALKDAAGVMSWRGIFASISGFAPADAKYLVQTADADLPNAQAMGALASGLVKNATTTGIQSIAAQGVDYYAPGGTDVAVLDGGTGASTALAARANLGLVINTNVQAWDADLDAIAALTSAANKIPYATGAQTWALADFPAAMRTFLTTPSSANLAALVSDETGGTGVLVFAGSPTITTPTIADFTNSTHTHANAAGGGQIAISTGISGLAAGIATFLATPSSANLKTAVTDETGTGGALVFAGSPTLTTPTIGDFTNSTHTHANAAGGGQVAISTGISGLAAGVATFLGTPSSANLASALTDETGSGLAVFATRPTVSLQDTLTTFQDDGDNTKQARFELSAIATGTTRTYTLPDRSDTLVDLGSSQTLAAKTLTTPTIASFTNATHNHSNAAGGGQITTAALSDLATGVATFLTTPSSSNLKAALTDETGSGAAVFATRPTITLQDTLTTFQDDGDNTKQAVFELSAIATGTTRTYTLPNRSDTLVDLGSAQTLTSKTLTTPTIGDFTNAGHTHTNAAGGGQIAISSGISGLAAGIAAFLATPSSANLITAMTDETGTGASVFATRPTMSLQDTLTTFQDDGDNTKQARFELSAIATGTTRTYTLPDRTDTLVDLGSSQTLTSKTLTSPTLTTPTIASFTNATHTHANAAGGGQVAISTGISGLGTGVATFLGTPSSANLAAALTDETGSGAAMFGTSPTVTESISTAGSTPSIAKTAGAGTTATVSIAGNDITGEITVTPGGTGIVAGSVCTVTFAAAMPNANYGVLFSPVSTGAATLTTPPRAVTKLVGSFLVSNQTALTSGTQYVWTYLVVNR